MAAEPADNLPARMLDEDMEDLYENAPCGYLSTLADGTIVKVNRTFLDWTGYSRDVLLGKKRFQELLPVPGRIYYDTHFGPLLLMQGFVKELAFEVIHADGSRIPILLNSNLKRDDKGVPVLIRITILDARGRRAYENELMLARRKAQEAEAEVRRFNETLEQLVAARTAERDRLWSSAQDILAISTMDGQLVNCNPAFTGILGWTQDDIQKISYSELVHPDELPVYRKSLEDLKNGKPIQGAVVRRRRKDGSYRWLSWNIVPEAGLLYMVGRDVSQEKTQAEALRQAEDGLRQAKKMEAVGQLTGGIAHDFNNMLAGVVGNLQLMRIRMEQGRVADVMRYIDAAEAVADRATAMTQRLLAFSRQQTLTPKPTDVNQRILFMRDLVESTIGPGIRLELALGENVRLTLCDPNQLESALLNLALNARDAMPDGGQLTISTGNMSLASDEEALPIGVPPGNYVAVSVADSGTGMSEDVIERAFDPFFTTKPIGQGTGLGLSMIYGFARQSGGQIRIESALAVGTTVHLYLPVYLGPAQEQDAHADEAPPVTQDATATILLVDDEAPLRNLLAEVLSDRGYKVLQAENAQQGLSLLQPGQPVDLLVSDIGLRGPMNGRQFAEAARALRPDLKVMFITGYADKDMAGRSLSELASEIMIKPFRLDHFVGRIAELIRN